MVSSQCQCDDYLKEKDENDFDFPIEQHVLVYDISLNKHVLISVNFFQFLKSRIHFHVGFFFILDREVVLKWIRSWHYVERNLFHLIIQCRKANLIVVCKEFYDALIFCDWRDIFDDAVTWMNRACVLIWGLSWYDVLKFVTSSLLDVQACFSAAE